MSLYRQVTFTPDDQLVSVPSGQLAVCRFTLEEDKAVVFSIIHAEPNSQDLSLRVWVSQTAGGSPMEKSAPQTIHPKRVNPDLIGFMTPDAVYPDVVARMSYAPPGVYFLNVLNLIHTDNKFSFTAMDGDSFTDDDDGESHNCDC